MNESVPSKEAAGPFGEAVSHGTFKPLAENSRDTSRDRQMPLAAFLTVQPLRHPFHPYLIEAIQLPMTCGSSRRSTDGLAVKTTSIARDEVATMVLQITGGRARHVGRKC